MGRDNSNKGRPVPPDFEVIFVEQGRLDCEAWYHAGRKTINRWLAEVGKDRLIERRAAYVRSLRSQGRWITRASNLIEHRMPRKSVSQTIRDNRRVSPALARRAARFLQQSRNGGWVVAPKSDGTWIIGTRCKSPAEVVDMAESKGFDRKAATLQIRAEGGED